MFLALPLEVEKNIFRYIVPLYYISFALLVLPGTKLHPGILTDTSLFVFDGNVLID